MIEPLKLLEHGKEQLQKIALNHDIMDPNQHNPLNWPTSVT